MGWDLSKDNQLWSMRNASITGTGGQGMQESMAQVVEKCDDHWLWWLRNARINGSDG